MPAGIPQVEVEFLVDADGILSVRAVERRSGNEPASKWPLAMACLARKLIVWKKKV